MAQLLDGLDVVYAADEAAESSDDNPNDSDDSDASLGSGGVADASLGSDGVADASLGSGGAAAARAAAVARGGGGAAAAVVAENGLASLRRARLAPGVFGAAVALRNEPRAARRIEVAAVRAAARAPGVAAGDVLVAINGKPLPRGASAEELQDLVRSNPKYALAAVDALLWRARAAAGGGAPAGGELCVHCGAGAAGVTWARVAFPGRAALDGAFAAAAVGGRAARLHVRPGDVLVGLNHEPVPRRHAAAALLQRFSSAAARGALTLNLWRCHDADVLDEIRRQCAAAEARSLAVDPSVAARLPRPERAAVADTRCLGDGCFL
jgi:hypothetical protein